ncbi:hypothetical protein GC089_15360 [Cellulomonas sp. JZ18]|nr:hypothetical protein GC089_15360 [Cellulomonas sp. JZ18]
MALAQRMVDAVGPDTPPAERESRRVHLVRSYVFAGRHADAVELAEQIRVEGFVVPATAASLARTMYSAGLVIGDDALVQRWLDVWEEQDANPASALAARARYAADRGDAHATLAAVRALPTTTLNALGEEVRRIELLHEEIWALVRLGDRRRALKVAAAAVDAGVAPGAPGALGVLLGHERTVALASRLDERLWGEYVTRCVMDATDETRTFLRWMHEARPGDAKVLAAVALLRPTLSLEEAVEWSVDLRRHGAAEQCPLVAFAADVRVEPRIRALAGALAWSAYRDERGLAGLEEALALVPAGTEAALLAELEVVAPGLVGAA